MKPPAWWIGGVTHSRPLFLTRADLRRRSRSIEVSPHRGVAAATTATARGGTHGAQRSHRRAAAGGARCVEDEVGAIARDGREVDALDHHISRARVGGGTVGGVGRRATRSIAKGAASYYCNIL